MLGQSNIAGKNPLHSLEVKSRTTFCLQPFIKVDVHCKFWFVLIPEQFLCNAVYKNNITLGVGNNNSFLEQTEGLFKQFGITMLRIIIAVFFSYVHSKNIDLCFGANLLISNLFCTCRVGTHDKVKGRSESLC